MYNKIMIGKDKASNVACSAELGQFPLIIAINQRIVNYLFTSKTGNRILLLDNLF